MASAEQYHQALVIRHPFWELLSPTVIKQRIEQILTASDSEARIQALSPVEYALLLKEAPETRPLLLELAQPEQIRTVLDLDCWERETLRSTRVLEWLEELQRSGGDVWRRTLAILDIEMLILTFRQHIRVHAALPTEEADEPNTYDEVLANELYHVEFVSADSPWNERIVRLLQFLRLVDLDFYHGLMQGVMWEQDSELAEWAYRWQSGRLQDEGFPDYYSALETYSLVDLEHTAPLPETPLQAPGAPESAVVSGLVPSYAWSLTPVDSPLATVLSGDLSVATQERLVWEMVYLCNRELVADQVDFADAAAVRASLSRVHAYLNVGLEYLRQHTAQSPASVLTGHTLQAIYQIGFTLSMRQHQRAWRLQTHLNSAPGLRRTLPGLARQVVDGLLHRPPQFFAGASQPGEIGYGDFVSLRDITLVEAILTSVEYDPAYRLRSA